MITVVYSTHKSDEYNKEFKKHILDSVGLKNIQVLEYINKNQFSLSEIYNRDISRNVRGRCGGLVGNYLCRSIF